MSVDLVIRGLKAENQPCIPMLINTTQYCASVLARFEVDLHVPKIVTVYSCDGSHGCEHEFLKLSNGRSCTPPLVLLDTSQG